MAPNVLARLFFESAEDRRLREEIVASLLEARLVREPLNAEAALSGKLMIGASSYEASCGARKAGSASVFEMAIRIAALSGGEDLPAFVPLHAVQFEAAFVHVASRFRPAYGYVVEEEVEEKEPPLAEPLTAAATAAEGARAVRRIYPVNFLTRSTVDRLGGVSALRRAGFRRVIVFPVGDVIAFAREFLVWPREGDPESRIAGALRIQ